MSLRVAIQMDPIATIDLHKDSTLLLIKEAARREHTLFYYEPQHLTIENGKVSAYVSSLAVYPFETPWYQLGPSSRVLLDTMDVILMRQDPPFNMRYITATYLLERLMDRTCIVNNPTEVRNCPEKMLVSHFPELMPPTLITENSAAIEQFRRQYEDIILKPLYAHGGRDVLRLQPNDDNLSVAVEMMLRLYPCPFIIQQYLPAIHTEGDKRIVLIEGIPRGTLTRIPAQGQVRSNLVAGGTAVAADLTKRDQEICDAIGPELKKRGLVFAGIDVIGGYLTEINVTSPTGLAAINRFCHRQLEAELWDAIETRVTRLSSS